MVSHQTDFNSSPPFAQNTRVDKAAAGNCKAAETGQSHTVGEFQKLYDEKVQQDGPTPRRTQGDQAKQDSSKPRQQLPEQSEADQETPLREEKKPVSQELPEQASIHAASVLETLQYVEPQQRHNVAQLGKSRECDHNASTRRSIEQAKIKEEKVFKGKPGEADPKALQREVAMAKVGTDHSVSIQRQMQQPLVNNLDSTVDKSEADDVGGKTVMIDLKKTEEVPDWVVRPKPKVVKSAAGTLDASDKQNIESENLTGGGSAEKGPAVVAEKRPEIVAEKRPETVAEKRPETVAQKRPEIVAQKRPEIVAQKRPEIVAQKRPEVVAEKRPVSIVSPDEASTTESDEIIIARPKREIQAENGEPVTPAADDMMSTMKLDRQQVQQKIFGPASDESTVPQKEITSIDDLLKDTPDISLKSLELDKSENVGWPDAELPAPDEQVAKEIELLQNLEKRSGLRPSPFSAGKPQPTTQASDPLSRVPHDKLPEQAFVNVGRRPGLEKETESPADAKLTGFKTVVTTRDEVAKAREQQKQGLAQPAQAKSRGIKAQPDETVPFAETKSGITPQNKEADVTSTINLPRGVDSLKRAQAALKRGQAQKAGTFGAQAKERQIGEGLQEGESTLAKSQAATVPSQATRGGNVNEIIRFINEHIQNLRGAENIQNTKMVLDFSSNRFGNLNITIEQGSGQLSVTLQSDNDSSRQQLFDQREELARQLRQMGYGDVNVDIENNEQFEKEKQTAEKDDDSPDKNVVFRDENGNILDDLS